MHTDTIGKQLEKKATFEGAVKQLTQLVNSAVSTSELSHLQPLVSRCYTILSARYTSPGPWLAGKRLFQACLQRAQEVAAGADASVRLTKYVEHAQRMADDADSAAAEAAAPREPTLGELLLGLPAPQAHRSHLSDAGLVLDAVTSAPPQGSAAAAAALASLLGVSRQGEEEGGGQLDGQQQAQPGEVLASDLQQLLSGASGLGTDAEELQALLASIADQGAPPQPLRPPASRRVVASLPQLTVDVALLLRLGNGSQCPVCREELQAGDIVQQLPCAQQHVFHLPCLAPWLSQHNSCPVCRHELPTDDAAYEAHKEAQAEEEQARRGAANALSHNEFAYI